MGQLEQSNTHNSLPEAGEIPYAHVGANLNTTSHFVKEFIYFMGLDTVGIGLGRDSFHHIIILQENRSVVQSSRCDMRNAYKKIVNVPGLPDCSIIQDPEAQTWILWQLQADVRCMCIARRIADAFNCALARTSLPKSLKEAKVVFNVPSIVTVADSEAACGKAAYLLEPHLAGKWCKWLQNDGSPLSGRKLPALLEAFVHFSYRKSQQESFFEGGLMVLDLQGCLVQKSAPGPACSRFQLTDPSISTAAEDSHSQFGETNQGKTAIKKFLDVHKCSKICRALWLDMEDVHVRAVSLRL